MRIFTQRYGHPRGSKKTEAPPNLSHIGSICLGRHGGGFPLKLTVLRLLRLDCKTKHRRMKTLPNGAQISQIYATSPVHVSVKSCQSPRDHDHGESIARKKKPRLEYAHPNVQEGSVQIVFSVQCSEYRVVGQSSLNDEKETSIDQKLQIPRTYAGGYSPFLAFPSLPFLPKPPQRKIRLCSTDKPKNKSEGGKGRKRGQLGRGFGQKKETKIN